MGEKYYTGTYEVACDPTSPRDLSTRLATLVLVDVHPAVYEACHPETQGVAPVLHHYAEITPDQGEGLISAYLITGRADRVVTMDGLHEALLNDVTNIGQRFRDPPRLDMAMRRQEALENYAAATGHDIGNGGPRI